jgi:hypothetical protein
LNGRSPNLADGTATPSQDAEHSEKIISDIAKALIRLGSAENVFRTDQTGRHLPALTLSMHPVHPGVLSMLTLDDFVALNIAYGLYLAISIYLTIHVAKALSSTGEIFLIRCFGQDEELARSTNRLLVIGFYLINLGFICLRLRFWDIGPANMIAEIAWRVGVTLLILGAMHFFNMLMIARMGRTVGRWLDETRSRPLPPPLPQERS